MHAFETSGVELERYKSVATTADVRRDLLFRFHIERKRAIRARLAEFKAVPESEIIYELLYCLLTPQSSAIHAERAVDELRSRSFANRPFDVRRVLSRKDSYVRFHNTKARRISAAMSVMPSVLDIVRHDPDMYSRRDRLVECVDGFGMKEATHFLRNIGRNGGLAILDRHILRNLHRVGVLRETPKTLTTKAYLRIESMFASFAEEMKIPIDELDLLFWSLETGEIRK